MMHSHYAVHIKKLGQALTFERASVECLVNPFKSSNTVKYKLLFQALTVRKNLSRTEC
jgi:hypothetical protein